MKKFSPRGLAYVLIALLGLLFSLPGLLPQSVQQQLPNWYTSQAVSLGLDLQGGSHLLLQADKAALFADTLDDQKALLTDALRKAHIYYHPITHSDSNGFALSLRKTSDLSAAKNVIKEVNQSNQGLAIFDLRIDGAAIHFTFNQAYQNWLLADAIDRSLEVVRKRLDESGLVEPDISKQGKDAILVQMPGVSDPASVKALLGTTAKMTFHWQAETGTHQAVIEVKDAKGKVYSLEKHVALQGEHITDAQGVFNSQSGQPVVNFQFDRQGAAIFADMTRENIGRVLAIVLDDEVVTAPVIRSEIPGGRGEISGSFTLQEAHNVALMLRAGSLPVPLDIVEERTVGPDLGSDAIAMGVTAGVAGALLVLGFMVALYGRWGLIASATLVINIALLFSLLGLFGATLTLPGIAGVILTIGMAVDANILINERIREELKRGRSAKGALKLGFDKAFATIIDSNVTTLIAVSLLLLFGSGPVKGFATTIALGIVTSLFTATGLTRLFMSAVVNRTGKSSIPMQGWKRLRPELTAPLNVIGAGKAGLILSAMLSLASVSLFFSPGLDYGVDFTGGTLIDMRTSSLQLEDVRAATSSIDAQVSIQQTNEEGRFLLRAATSDNPSAQVTEIQQVLLSADDEVIFEKVDAVGPRVSGDFADLTILALLIAGSGTLLFLWFRFESHFAAATIMTIGLDLTKTIGFFALSGVEFNLTAVASLLALLGYSINDKVVVFDRVRELLRADPDLIIKDAVNQAIGMTLTRTLFTSVTTVLALLPMAIYGGDAVASFALPMLFGVVVGTSSTLFVAAPILVWLGQRRARAGKAQLKPTAEEIQQQLAHIP